MHSMLKRHEVRLLRKAKHTQAEVAAITSVAVRSVRRIEGEGRATEKLPEADGIAARDAGSGGDAPTASTSDPEQPAAADDAVVVPPPSFDDAAERARRRIGRPSLVAPHRDRIEEILVADPTLASGEVLRRVREDGYSGRKSALYDLVRLLRPETKRPIVRFEGVAGEFCQHDFGHVNVKFDDGRRKVVHFFASRLKWSRWSEVTIVPNERVEPLVRALVGHYDRMGGVPLLGVFDRPKTIAIAWKDDGTVTQWNSTFLAVMAEMGVGAELCWPHAPEQKGSVENLVGWVKGSFFKSRRFRDEADLEHQLAEWHREVNHARPSRATNEIPAIRMARDEHARLRCLRVNPAELELRFPVQIGPTAMVTFHACMYSMPPQAMGLVATLYLGARHVRIAAGRWAATHSRLVVPGSRSILPEHRAAMLAAVSGERAGTLAMRERLLALGEGLGDAGIEIGHRRPMAWRRDVDLMHELLQLHGDAAMRAAVAAALAERTFGGEYVAHQLGEQDRLARVVFGATRVHQ
jgi:transposase